MRALDLFCGGGGAGMGLSRAGFDVTGIDINPQPNYPFEFHQLDVMKIDIDPSEYDFIWASPPCQAYSVGTQRWEPEKYPDLIQPVRALLENSGLPYVIENVPGAPLRNHVRLCGVMFDLRVIRHRHFESNFQFAAPKHRRHRAAIKRPGMTHKSWYQTVAGHGGNSNSYRLEDWQEAMGIDWMTKKELVESVPPAYSEYIARQFLGGNDGK